MSKAGQICLAYLFVVGNMLRGFSATAPAKNQAEFSLLCTIYNIAATPPNHLYDASELFKIEREIDEINASLSDEKWFNEIAKAEDASKLGEDFKTENDITEESWSRWKAAVSATAAKGGKFPRLSSDGNGKKLALAKLKNIANQVGQVRRKIEGHGQEKDLNEAKKFFDKAIYGETAGGEWPKDGYPVATSRQATCGTSATAAGTASGQSLIQDFLCLCGKQGSSNDADGKECTVKPPVAASWAAAGGGSTGTDKSGEATWREIKAGCNRTGTRRGTRTSADNLQAAIEAFLHALASKLSGTTSLPGVFGATQGTDLSNGCKGQINSNDGICVVYGTDPAQWTTKIVWLKNMIEALKLLRKAEDATSSIQADLSHLKMLQHRAEEVYLEAQTAVELEKTNFEGPKGNQSQRQNPSIPADKTTAQEPNAASIANLPRFILPWALLI
uniref:Variable surface glycoprotein n=1 Tax=Trypanosoma congolense TaxID=5692 RepID=Q26860_TRYCO|nr:variable surface glycoprotein [Trypanosoma congolense]